MSLLLLAGTLAFGQTTNESIGVTNSSGTLSYQITQASEGTCPVGSPSGPQQPVTTYTFSNFNYTAPGINQSLSGGTAYIVSPGGPYCPPSGLQGSSPVVFNGTGYVIDFYVSNQSSQSATYLAPALALSPAALSFGNQNTGTTSASQGVTLSNTGALALSITSITITGTNSGDFVIAANTCGSSIAAGGSCNVSVSFAPTALGARSGALTVVDNAASSPPVTLSGTGVTPPIITTIGVANSSGTLSYQITQASGGTCPVGSPSGPQQPITLYTFSNFTFAAPGISQSLSGGAEYIASPGGPYCPPNGLQGSSPVVFSETGYAIDFYVSNQTNQSATYLVPALALSPGALSFGNQNTGTTSAGQGLTLSNGGGLALSISSLSITGANSGDFVIQSNTCGSGIAAGSSCAITVSFAPSALGTRSAAVTIVDNAAGSPHTAALSGTGVTPTVTFSAGTIAFGNQNIGTASAVHTMTLSNTGGGTLTISSLTISGTNSGDFHQTNNCGSTVAAGGSCVISVTFSPPVAGSRSASISVADNAAGSPQAVTLSGTGVAIPKLAPATPTKEYIYINGKKIAIENKP